MRSLNTPEALIDHLVREGFSQLADDHESLLLVEVLTVSGDGKSKTKKEKEKVHEQVL